jgi:hypothetical protein
MKRSSLLVVSSLAFGFLCSSVFAGIGWEAEDAVAINPPQAVFEDANASGGKYVTSPTSNEGSVEYEFEVPADGTYFMWARHLSIDSGRNSCYLVIDDPASPLDNADLAWDTILEPQPRQLGEEVDVENKDTYSNDWEWIRVFGRVDGLWNILTIRTFELSAGKHSMYIWTRERETKMDCFYLTASFDDQPVLPHEAMGFAAVDPAKKLAVTWGSLK